MARYLGPGLIPDTETFGAMFRMVSAYGVAIPPEIAAIFRTLATLQRTLARLAPGFDIIKESERFADSEVTGKRRSACSSPGSAGPGAHGTGPE